MAATGALLLLASAGGTGATRASSGAEMAEADRLLVAGEYARAIDLYRWPVSLEDTRARCVWERPAAEPGYGITTAASREAMLRFAGEEGYLLDATYTAKAAAALMAMASDGRLERGSRVLLIHTGGLSTTAAGQTH